jgi:hypothetical protein
MSHSPLLRNLRSIESYIAIEAPTQALVEDAEVGLNVVYADVWADELFQWMSSGRTILSYCQQPQKPARSLIFSWLQNQEPRFDYLRDKFRSALLNRALALVDEVGSIADEPLPMGPKGETDRGAAADKKQRMDAKLQLAALFDPSHWAPLSKQAIQSQTVNQLNITQTNVTNLTDAQLQEFISEAERRRLRDRSTPGAGVGSIIPTIRTTQP